MDTDSALDALNSLQTLDTLCPLDSCETLNALRTLGLKSLNALDALNGNSLDGTSRRNSVDVDRNDSQRAFVGAGDRAIGIYDLDGVKQSARLIQVVVCRGANRVGSELVLDDAIGRASDYDHGLGDPRPQFGNSLRDDSQLNHDRFGCGQINGIIVVVNEGNF